MPRRPEELFSTHDFNEIWQMTPAGTVNRLRRIQLEFPPDFLFNYKDGRQIFLYRKAKFDAIITEYPT